MKELVDKNVNKQTNKKTVTTTPWIYKTVQERMSTSRRSMEDIKKDIYKTYRDGNTSSEKKSKQDVFNCIRVTVEIKVSESKKAVEKIHDEEKVEI